MRPRRDVFALDYIAETLDCYERHLRQLPELDEARLGLLRWAHDVLSTYFRETAVHRKINPLRERFAHLPPIRVDERSDRIVSATPYLRDLSGPPPVAYDDLLRLAKRRRSVRWYRPDPVPRELVDQAICIAREAPSACNRQPFFFRIFDDPKLVQAVAELPMGTKGFRENFPMILAIVGRLRCYFHPRDRHLIYIDASLAAMNLMLALESLGLSSCPINWPDIPDRERRAADLLDLEPDERVIMLISIGFPDPSGLVAYSHKKSLDELRSYNR